MYIHKEVYFLKHNYEYNIFFILRIHVTSLVVTIYFYKYFKKDYNYN